MIDESNVGKLRLTVTVTQSDTYIGIGILLFDVRTLMCIRRGNSQRMGRSHGRFVNNLGHGRYDEGSCCVMVCTTGPHEAINPIQYGAHEKLNIFKRSLNEFRIFIFC